MNDNIRTNYVHPPTELPETVFDYSKQEGFFRSVENPYAETYFGDLVGARMGAAPGTAIAGLETPDPRTLILRLTRPTGGTVVPALGMPLAAPQASDPPKGRAMRDARAGKHPIEGLAVHGLGTASANFRKVDRCRSGAASLSATGCRRLSNRT